MAEAESTSSTTRRVVPPGEFLRELEEKAASPPRSRARRTVGRRFGSLGAVAGAAALLVVFAAIPALAVHAEGFQLEGNATATDLTYGAATSGPAQHPAGSLSGSFAGPYDWDSLFTIQPGAAPGNALGTVSGPKATLPGNFTGADFEKDFSNTGTTFVTSDPTTFATGSKDTLDVTPGWQCNFDHNVNSKVDIINGYAATLENSDGKFFYYGLEKDVNNGDNNVGVWLLQDSTVGCTSSSGNVAFNGHHVNGDLLIVSAFTNGGGVSNITVYAWENGSLVQQGPVGIDCLATSSQTDSVCATVNEKTIQMPWLSADGGVINAPKVSPNFFEGGINLSDYPAFADTCFNRYILDTRSSQSTTATLFDYVQGSISTCKPNLTLQKTPDSGTYFQGQSFNWDIAVTNSGNAPATGAVVTDTIASGLTIGTPTTPAGTCSVSGQTVTCSVDVAVGATIHITVPVTVGSGVFGSPSDTCVLVNNSATVVIGSDSSSDTGQVTACRLSVTKTATPAFHRTYTYTIDKSVDPSTFNFFDGQTGTADYNVDVTRTTTDSAWTVTGQITVNNPAPMAATVDSVTDTIDNGGTCAVTGGTNVTVAASGSTTLDYSCTYASAPSPSSFTNTATATAYTVTYTGTATGDFSTVTPSTTGPSSVDVTDTLGGALGSVSTDGTTSFPYTQPEDCSGISYTDGFGTKTIPNTATITQTGQHDSASVTVNCYRLDVTKTATPAFHRTYTYTINKTGDVGEVTLSSGQSVDVHYTVTVVGTQTDSAWTVTGQITVNNPAPMAATVDSVTDTIDNGGTCAVTGGTNVTVAASGSTTLDYSCTYASAPSPSSFTNTATATAYTVTYTGTATGDFSTVTPSTSGQAPPVTVTDSYQGTLGTAGIGTTTFHYTRTISTAGLACGDYNFPNTATITETGQTSSWNILVHVTNCGVPGKTPGFWRSNNGHALLSTDGINLTTPVTIGAGSHSFTVTTLSQSDQILGNSDCATTPNVIFVCGGSSGLVAGINPNSFEVLGAQTLALTYNIELVPGFTGQTLSALGVNAYITSSLTALGVTPSITVNDLLTICNNLIANSFQPGGTATQTQIGEMDSLLSQVNRETL